MIAIKGMDMPKSCEDCRFNEYGYIFLEMIDIEEYEKTKNIRHKDCPLIDLGSEDISWEELKTQCIKFLDKKGIFGYSIIQINEDTINLFDESRNSMNCVPYISFLSDGNVFTYNNISIIKTTPFHMWQIIKALIGDER